MSFDRLAPHYTWMERVLAGGRLQRCRLAWLEALAGRETILIAGVGHGHFLHACARRFPRATIVSVDASAAMMRHARRRASLARPRLDGLEFVHATLPDWIPPIDRFDAVITHFFLDCFAPGELEAVIAILAQSARRNALWAISDFAVPSCGLARQRARALHAMMYIFFRSVTGLSARRMTKPDPMLARAGFTLGGRRTFEWGLLQADLWVRTSDGHGTPTIAAAAK